MKMTLKALRALVPSWEWRAVRDGFGWNYEGRNGDRIVTARPYSHLSGYGDDNFSTVWHIDEIVGNERRSETLTRWVITIPLGDTREASSVAP